MDNADMAETIEIESQPIEAVTAEVETSLDPSQSEPKDESGLYVEVEGEQTAPNKTNMTPEQSYAAFKREKEKRQKKQAELDAERKANELVARELAELKATVSNLTKAPKPKLADFDYDETAYESALDDYYAKPASNQPNPKQNEGNQGQSYRNEDAEFYMYQKEREIEAKLPDYQDRKSRLTSMLVEKGQTDTDSALQYLADAAMQSNVDIAKVVVAFEQMPTYLDRAIKVAHQPIMLAKLLAEAESKVKTRSVTPNDTVPEPHIRTSGAIDTHNTQVQKLKETWIKDPTTRNFKAYQDAKKQQNKK